MMADSRDGLWNLRMNGVALRLGGDASAWRFEIGDDVVHTMVYADPKDAWMPPQERCV